MCTRLLPAAPVPVFLAKFLHRKRRCHHCLKRSQSPPVPAESSRKWGAVSDGAISQGAEKALTGHEKASYAALPWVEAHIRLYWGSRGSRVVSCGPCGSGGCWSGLAVLWIRRGLFSCQACYANELEGHNRRAHPDSVHGLEYRFQWVCGRWLMKVAENPQQAGATRERQW